MLELLLTVIFVLAFLALPIGLIIEGINSIKNKRTEIEGHGNPLRGRSGAAAESQLESKTVYGRLAEEMGKIYIIAGIGIIILYIILGLTILLAGSHPTSLLLK